VHKKKEFWGASSLSQPFKAQVPAGTRDGREAWLLVRGALSL